VAFSPDGKTLASASAGTRESSALLKLWDLGSGREVAQFRNYRVTAETLTFAPDGKTLATAGRGSPVRLWDALTGEQHATLVGHRQENSVSFAPDGKQVVTGGTAHEDVWVARVLRWGLEPRGPAVLVGGADTGQFATPGFSAEQKLLATVNVNESKGEPAEAIRLVDATTGRLRHTLEGHARQIRSLAFSTDGKLLATGGVDGGVRLWDTGTGKERAVWEGHAGRVRSLAFREDGKVLAAGDHEGVVRLWDVEAGKEQAVLRGHSGPVLCLAFAPDGRTAASGSVDETVKLWDVAGGKEVATLSGHDCSVEAVAFSPDGALLAASTVLTGVRLWETATGKLRSALPANIHEGSIAAVAFAPDGKLLATGSKDRTIKLWQVSDGKPQRTLGAFHPVRSVAFSADGKSVTAVTLDRDPIPTSAYGAVRTVPVGEVRFWDGAIGQPRVAPQ
jgi:WD40 repeat protein